MSLVVAVDDPRAPDVRALLAAHLEFSRSVTPVEYSFALDIDGLVDRSITFFGARLNGVLVGMGALKHLDADHAELKSMHTRGEFRAQGVGRALVEHILAVAAVRGYRRVSLETGITDDFVAANRLYTTAGFHPCEPFDGYESSPFNRFMTIDLNH